MTADGAKDLAVERLQRKLGQNFLTEAYKRCGELIDHWNKRGITEPSAVYAVGEPGADQWDEG